MTTEQIIEQIDRFQANLLTKRDGQVEINDPVTLSETIVKIRVLLVTLTNKVADAELEYKRLRAGKYAQNIKDGMKRSPASDSLRYDEELIEMESVSDRLRNYMKYVDGLVSSVQSLLKVQSSSEKNQF